MNPHQRQQLEDRLKALPKGEQDRLFKLAKAKRADDQKRRRREHTKFEDLDDPRPGSSKRSAGDPVRMYVLKLLAAEMAAGKHAGDESTPDERAAEGDAPAAASVGVAVEVGKRRCVVRPMVAGVLVSGEGDDVACRLSADLAGRQQADLCVGDRVAYEIPADDRRAPPTVTHVLPRRTVLTRRDPTTRQPRAIAANVDAVVIVVSVVSPPLHPRLIDRYLLAIEDSWVEQPGRHADDPDPAHAIIAVNKTDLLDTLGAEDRAAELAKLEPYRSVGADVVMCSADAGAGIGELRALLAGKVVVFVGHSGVGKSTLTNALHPSLNIRVGAVGTAANRGRHTTTSAQLHEIRTADGSHDPFWVIDTPGIRYFGLDELTPAELRDSMPEFRKLRQACKFNDCTHTHEPGCAIRESLGNPGGVHPERYETYLRLLEELERDGTTPQGGRIRSQLDHRVDGPSPGDEQ
ncbi:MAG: hypothetical protein DHS20C14_17420 [Phycisphaeraceae bacterium]|nr:MAG: hypothetical protein DHS20C14_17420 [Phycisphaeraceae bacterium]